MRLIDSEGEIFDYCYGCAPTYDEAVADERMYGRIDSEEESYFEYDALHPEYITGYYTCTECLSILGDGD